MSCSSVRPNPPADALSVSELLRAKESYVGRSVTVEGRVHVQTLSGLHACEQGTPCPKYDDALLTLMDAQVDRAPAGQMLPLYRRFTAGGPAEAIHCQILDQDRPTFDCGPFTPDVITTVRGVFDSRRVPDQTVGDSTGHIRVLTYRDVYYLLIADQPAG